MQTCFDLPFSVNHLQTSCVFSPPPFVLLFSADFRMQDTSEEFLASVKSSFWRSMAFQMSTGAGGGRTTTFITGTRAKLWHELRNLPAITYTFWHWMRFFLFWTRFIFKVKTHTHFCPYALFIIFCCSWSSTVTKWSPSNEKVHGEDDLLKLFRDAGRLANKLTFWSSSVSSYWRAEVHRRRRCRG